jgi:hypothetical protein
MKLSVLTLQPSYFTLQPFAVSPRNFGQNRGTRLLDPGHPSGTRRLNTAHSGHYGLAINVRLM